jgi:hypothetical protein
MGQRWLLRPDAPARTAHIAHRLLGIGTPEAGVAAAGLMARAFTDYVGQTDWTQAHAREADVLADAARVARTTACEAARDFSARADAAYAAGAMSRQTAIDWLSRADQAWDACARLGPGDVDPIEVARRVAYGRRARLELLRLSGRPLLGSDWQLAAEAARRLRDVPGGGARAREEGLALLVAVADAALDAPPSAAVGPVSIPVPGSVRAAIEARDAYVGTVSKEEQRDGRRGRFRYEAASLLARYGALDDAEKRLLQQYEEGCGHESDSIRAWVLLQHIALVRAGGARDDPRVRAVEDRERRGTGCTTSAADRAIVARQLQ